MTFSKPLLNRCIPVQIRTFQKWVSTNIIAFLNKADIFQKVLGDLYASWQEMITLCFVAVGEWSGGGGGGVPCVTDWEGRGGLADIFQKVLGDLYASWQEMITLCFCFVCLLVFESDLIDQFQFQLKMAS